ncbi:MAG: PepSY-associated TM helix domain-containing protein [Spongiibacter marinus]|uniref:PepSY-associated TM helix domain-containing protein n=1 Tax=Spongiibacter marinus TaxID=354246 RepID=UPI003C420470
MLKLQQKTTQTMLALHGWGAVIFGLLLYWVILTGTIAVFADDINDWASPLPVAIPETFPLGTDAMLRKAAADVAPEYLDELIVFATAGGRIRAFFHTHAESEDGEHPEEKGVLFVFDPASGDILQRFEGTQSEIEAQSHYGKLGHFLVEWHVQLHVPSPWGLMLTGILGLSLLVACVSGFAMHRHLIKDAFLRRRRGGDVLSHKDAHVMASTWNLPFAFILAFTGSFYSLAGAFAIPAIAMVAFGGDQEKLIETVQGLPPAEDPRPAEMANIDTMLEDVRAAGHRTRFLTVDHWGRQDARISVFPWQAEGELLPKGYSFDAQTGENLGEKPALGQSPSLGSDLVALMGPLHFGNFAGWLSKTVWFALGFAGAYVCISGLTLWVKRREQQKTWQYLLRATLWSAWGLPLALVAAAAAYLLQQAGVLAGAVEPLMFKAFGLCLALSGILAGIVRRVTGVRRILVISLGLGLCALVALRLLLGGPGWVSAATAGLTAVVVLDVALLLGGAWLLRREWRQTLASPEESLIDTGDMEVNTP